MVHEDAAHGAGPGRRRKVRSSRSRSGGHRLVLSHSRTELWWFRCCFVCFEHSIHVPLHLFPVPVSPCLLERSELTASAALAMSSVLDASRGVRRKGEAGGCGEGSHYENDQAFTMIGSRKHLDVPCDSSPTVVTRPPFFDTLFPVFKPFCTPDPTNSVLKSVLGWRR